MLQISQLKLPVTHTESQLEKKLLKILKISRKDLKYYRISKKSLDARKKPELYYVYTVDFETEDDRRIIRNLKGKVREVSESLYLSLIHI